MTRVVSWILMLVMTGCSMRPSSASELIVDISTTGPVLIGWSKLDANFRRPGPTSGRLVEPGLGVQTPFQDAQPLPGFSAMISKQANVFLAMPDNGFGSKQNSVDFVLGFYEIAAEFAQGGEAEPGPVHVGRFTPIADPFGWLKNDKGVEMTIVADLETYPGTNDRVDPSIQDGRLLTGFDFDVESIAADGRGGYWIGEEFGPFLLHVNNEGALVSEPIAYPGFKSPSHPEVLVDGQEATIAASRGFEAIAFGTNPRFLYVTAEAAPTAALLRADSDDERLVKIFEFDTYTEEYTGRDKIYRKDGAAQANATVIGDMTHLGKDVFALIERDSNFGAEARLKKIYIVDLRVSDRSGVLCKQLALDLLKVENPSAIGGSGPFSLPFDSVESLSVFDNHTLVVGVDSNYPTQATRQVGVADGAEIIAVRFKRALVDLAPRNSVDGSCAVSTVGNLEEFET